MDNHQHRGPAPARKHRGRRFLLWLGGFVVVVVGLALIGMVYESAAEARDAQAFPPPGQMVDVGGHRLHLNCTGAGSPTVVIDAGLGGSSLDWTWVRQDVAKTTRVCTYDRAGMGWSEDGPLPRTAIQFTQELHTAGVPGPYVLAGHSLGGLPVRVFAHTYPTEVAGVVFIESMSPRQLKISPADVETPTAGQSRGFSILTLPARIGLLRLLDGPLGATPPLPPEVAKAYAANSVTPRFLQAELDEGTGLPASMVQAGAVTTFGDLPLIVLTRGLDLNSNPEWPSMQVELVQLSSQGEQFIAEKSGHNIERDQPEAAVDAIVRMVAKLRAAPKNPI
jgi:pimeloyl-ACP methyl ester carboxylesterase